MIHGVVSYVNEELLYFKLNDNIVLPAIYLANNAPPGTINLPKLGDRLTIKNAHLHEDFIAGNCVYTMCHKSTLKKCKVPANKGLYYLWMTQDYRMGAADLFVITNMYETVKDTIPYEMNICELILRYVESCFLNSKIKVSENGWCENSRLSRIQCNTISQCKQVQLKSDRYNDFPFWSYGVHWSSKEEVLIGYLFVHPKFGTICFKDSSYTVGCIINKTINDNLEKILNKTVYIKRYCIFTEIFNPNKEVNLEYLFLTYNNITSIDRKRKRIDFEEAACHFKMNFIILSKSYVTVTRDRRHHFWLEVKEWESNYLENYKKCFLCLPETLIHKWASLDLGYSYSVNFKNILQRTYEIEYTRIDPTMPQFQISTENEAEISPRGRYFQQENLVSLGSETLPALLRKKNLISFQAVLKYRKFIKPNCSRTNTIKSPPGFGTLSEKTFILEFDVENDQTISLYLNNWERLTMPIGLIPGAIINVRNVVIQKMKYFKSTALTTLEIVEYKPKKLYVTARLLSDDDFGPPQRFGAARYIPSGALIHGLVNSFFVTKLFLKRSCSECGYMSRVPGDFCVKCKGNMELECKFQFLIRDRAETSKVIVKNVEIVKVFMGLLDTEWDEWMETFQSCCYYHFQRNGKTVDSALSIAHLQFINITHEIIKTRERGFFLNIGILCRKMDNDREYDKMKSLWFGLKAKSLS